MKRRMLRQHDFGEPTKVLGDGPAEDPGPPAAKEGAVVGWHPHRGFAVLGIRQLGLDYSCRKWTELQARPQIFRLLCRICRII